MATRTYRMDHDLGFAPNPFFGWCSLACCMPKIRKHAQQDDLIVGLAGSNSRGLGRYHPRVIYWMRVEETPDFDGYWNDPRFRAKRPQADGPKMRVVGDRTYRHEEGVEGWRFDTSMHFVPGAPQPTGGHVVTDTSVDRLLLGQDYTYWGGGGPVVPGHLLGQFPSGRGYKIPPPGKALDELHDLLDVEHPKRLAGNPADWDNPRYFAPSK